jgi:hypothetical protein
MAGCALAAPVADAAPANFEGIGAGGEVAFFSTDDRLVPGDTDNRRDVYLRSFDAEVGSYVTRVVSTGPVGGNDAFPAFFEESSVDGARVVFSTQESLVAIDTDHRNDIYLRDLDAGTTSLLSGGAASCAPACGNGDFEASFAGASADGGRILFRSDEPLDPAVDTDSAFDVYVRDLGAGSISVVSAGLASCAPACGNADLGSDLRGVSADGSTAFFVTNEQLGPATDADESSDVYARVLPSGPTTHVSAGDPACAPCGNGDESPAVFVGSSADGAEVFVETSEMLAPGDEDGANDVYQRESGTTSLVSSGSAVLPANFSGASADGERVFFVSPEGLVEADENGANDIYMWQGANPTLVTSGSCCGSSFNATTSGGDSVVFTTTEPLNAADTDASADVYKQVIGGGAPALVSRGEEACAPACGNGPNPAIFNGASADTSKVFFTSVEQLTTVDTDSNGDIHMRDLGTSATALISNPGVSCPTGGGCPAIFNRASGDGAHVFFQTTERATEGDVDSELDVYERSGGQTRLVSTGNSVVLGPATPVLEGTNPASPNPSTTPSIFGQADANTSIKLYTTPDCSGEVAAVGTSLDLGGTGIQAGVLPGSTTAFRATATDESGDTSPCSNAVTYKQEDAPPPPPPPPPPPDPEGGSGGGKPGGPNAPPKFHSGGIAFVTPRTRITFATAAKTRSRRPTFRFTDLTGQPGTRFICKLDRRRWRGCESPKRLKRLAPGRHVFKVKAVNAAGVWEARPIKRRFKVIGGKR